MATRISALKRAAIAAALAALSAAAFAAGPARAAAADDCLSKPNAKAPQGSHWRYRVEHASHRKCWYVAESGHHEAAVKPHEGARKHARAAAQNADEAPPPAQAPQRAGDAAATGGGDSQGNPQAAAPQATASAEAQGTPVPGSFSGTALPAGVIPAATAPSDQPQPAAAPSDQSPATATAGAGTAGGAGGDVATEPPTGTVAQDDTPAPAAKPVPAAQPSPTGWTVLKIAAAVLTLGVLMFVAFKAPVRRPARLADDRRPDWDVRRSDEHTSPSLVPQDQDSLSHAPMEEVTTAPRGESGRLRWEPVQTPERVPQEGSQA